MYKMFGVISWILFSFSVHGMAQDKAKLTIDSYFENGGLSSSQIQHKTLKDIIDSVVALLSQSDLNEADKEKAEQIKSLLIGRIEEFHVLQLGVFHQQGKINKEIAEFSKNYRVLKSEQDTFEALLTGLREPRVDEIALSCESRGDTPQASKSETLLPAKNSIFLQMRAKFLRQMIEPLQNELEDIGNVSKATGAKKEKISASITKNLERQQELHRLNEEKEKYRQDLSAIRHGCLLVLAVLKNNVLKQLLTKGESEAIETGGEIGESLKNTPDFSSFIKDVSL